MIEDTIDAITYGLNAIAVGFYDGKMYTLPKRKRTYKVEEIIERGQIIHQDETTVLKIGRDRFIARPEAGDVYDKEKGVLICVAKALGVTTTDILNLCENAIEKKSKK